MALNMNTLSAILTGVGRGLLAPPVLGQNNWAAAGRGIGQTLEEQAARERENVLRQQQFAREDAEIRRQQANIEAQRQMTKDWYGTLGENYAQQAEHNRLSLAQRAEQAGLDRASREKVAGMASADRRAAQAEAKAARNALMEGSDRIVQRIMSGDTPNDKQAQSLLNDLPPQEHPAVMKKWAEARAAQPRQNKDAKQALEISESKYDENMKTLDRIESLSKGWGTTGLPGYLSSFVPGTGGYDTRAITDTLLARLGFEELLKLKNDPRNKTGGALGQVTERELALLQSVTNKFEANMSEEQFKRTLIEFREQARSSMAKIRAAYEEDLAQGYYGAEAREEFFSKQMEEANRRAPPDSWSPDRMRGIREPGYR